MKCALVIVVLSANALLVLAQNEKPGSCPPPFSVDICFSTCEEDLHCRGPKKCCPTQCGGTFCVEPITMRVDKQYQGTSFIIILRKTISGLDYLV